MLLFIGAGITAAHATMAANIAWRRQKEVMKNSIQWRMNDIEGAGLNKYLAVTSGVGASGGSVPMASQIQAGGIGDDIKKIGSTVANISSAREAAKKAKYDTESAAYNSVSAKEVALQNVEKTVQIQAETPFKVSSENLKDTVGGAAKRFLESNVIPYLKGEGRRLIGNDAVEGYFKTRGGSDGGAK